MLATKADGAATKTTLYVAGAAIVVLLAALDFLIGP